MIILGIHDSHDASACLMINGKVVAAAQEERWSGLKGDYGYPYNAVKYCLKFAGIEPNDIDKIVLNGRSWNPVLTYFKRNANFASEDWLREQTHYFRHTLGIDGYEKKDVDYYEVFKDVAKNKGWRLDDTYPMDGLLNYVQYGDRNKLPGIRRQTIARILDVDESIIKETDHENTHIAYAYFASPIRGRAIVLTAEGCGDYSNSTVSQIDKKGTPVPYPNLYTFYQHSHNFDNHIGHIYQYMTLLLGMRPARDEYKVMGLAPYADERRSEECYKLLRDILKVSGLKICVDKMPSDFYFRFRRLFEGHRFDDVAGGLQMWVEDLLFLWADNCARALKCNQIVFAGGGAQNIKAVKKMGELPRIRNISVMPAAGDTSSSIGACYYEAWQNSETLEPLETMYLGPEPFENELVEYILNEAREKGFFVNACGNMPFVVAKLLSEGNIIARCSGRMEFGLRALGNRSIMADPRNLIIVNRLNKAIKRRDFWMPFTPTILTEKADQYIENPKGLDARFMTQAFESTLLARKHLPAALHPGDWTVRPQLLKREDNPEYYDIINNFYRLTGVGAILNTSFNLHGEPIVLGEKEALRTFENSDLDGLLIEQWLILKKPLKI